MATLILGKILSHRNHLDENHNIGFHAELTNLSLIIIKYFLVSRALTVPYICQLPNWFYTSVFLFSMEVSQDQVAVGAGEKANGEESALTQVKRPPVSKH